MSDVLNATITVRMIFKNICTKEDLDESDMTLQEMVRFLIDAEGLFGVCEDDYEIVRIEQYEAQA